VFQFLKVEQADLLCVTAGGNTAASGHLPGGSWSLLGTRSGERSVFLGRDRRHPHAARIRGPDVPESRPQRSVHREV
jgi:hypothetical protein